MKTLILILITAITVISCASPQQVNEEQNRKAALSPLDKCIEEANFDTGMCNLKAMSIPNLTEKNQYQQRCEDRRLSMKSLCYSRFK